jgi:beta-glucosidase
MYDRNEPSFAFGHGLSHTKFEFKSLKLDRPEIKDGETVDLSVEVKNAGPMDSDELLPLYVRYPNSKVARPAKALKVSIVCTLNEKSGH